MEKIIIVNNWIKDGYNLHCEGLWFFGEFGFFFQLDQCSQYARVRIDLRIANIRIRREISL